MPFVNDAQRRACYAQMSRDVKAGRSIRWDCSAYARGEPSTARSRSRSRSPKKAPRVLKKIHTGKRGAQYRIIKTSDGFERKVYITRSKQAEKVHKGPRGGLYRLVRTSKGQLRKVYVS